MPLLRDYSSDKIVDTANFGASDDASYQKYSSSLYDTWNEGVSSCQNQVADSPMVEATFFTTNLDNGKTSKETLFDKFKGKLFWQDKKFVRFSLRISLKK